MNAAPAKLTFVSNLLTNKLFIAQVATLIATGATMLGFHLFDSQAAQQQLIVALDVLSTVVIMALDPSIPVSFGAPITVPAPKDVPAGTSVVTVVPPSEPQASTIAPAVQPIAVGTHTVQVTPPVAVGLTAPADVVVTPVS